MAYFAAIFHFVETSCCRPRAMQGQILSLSRSTRIKSSVLLCEVQGSLFWPCLETPLPNFCACRSVISCLWCCRLSLQCVPEVHLPTSWRKQLVRNKVQLYVVHIQFLLSKIWHCNSSFNFSGGSLQNNVFQHLSEGSSPQDTFAVATYLAATKMPAAGRGCLRVPIRKNVFPAERRDSTFVYFLRKRISAGYDLPFLECAPHIGTCSFVSVS